MLSSRRSSLKQDQHRPPEEEHRASHRQRRQQGKDPAQQYRQGLQTKDSIRRAAESLEALQLLRSLGEGVAPPQSAAGQDARQPQAQEWR